MFTDLIFLFYLVIIASMTFYAMLDGFDLGVGILHLFAPTDIDRRTFLNAIGPVWDGNEVWLVIVGGGLLAGFPLVYATLFSAYYMPFMVLLMALIFRAVAIEVRSKTEHPSWRKFFDFIFFFGSLLIAFGLGVVMGNFIEGIPLNARHEYIGHVWQFFTPYTLLTAITAVALFAMHGSIYLLMKTEGELHNRLRKWSVRTIITFVICYGCTSLATLIYMPHMTERFQAMPWLFPIALLNMLAIANIPREINRGNDGRAFLSSCAAIAFLLILYAIGTFPHLIRSRIDPANNSIDVWRASASETTLSVLMIIVLIGIPLVIAYMAIIYRIFRGKVKLDHMSY